MITGLATAFSFYNNNLRYDAAKLNPWNRDENDGILPITKVNKKIVKLVPKNCELAIDDRTIGIRIFSWFRKYNKKVSDSISLTQWALKSSSALINGLTGLTYRGVVEDTRISRSAVIGAFTAWQTFYYAALIGGIWSRWCYQGHKLLLFLFTFGVAFVSRP